MRKQEEGISNHRIITVEEIIYSGGKIFMEKQLGEKKQDSHYPLFPNVNLWCSIE